MLLNKLLICFSLSPLFMQTIFSQADRESEVDDIYTNMCNFYKFLAESNNNQKILSLFSANSFSNEMMLGEDCAGYIKDSDRKNKAKLRFGIMSFLQDIKKYKAKNKSDATGWNDLQNYLTRSQISPLKESASDHFYIICIKTSELSSLISSQKICEYLQKQFSNHECYATITLIGDGTFVFLWEKDQNRWRIYHISMWCM